MSLSKVLIIEDSEPEQYICKYILEEFSPGVKVFQAYDGAQAIEVLENLEESPDIIFLDINMPGMNGYKFLDFYNEKLSSENTLVAILTSSVNSKDKERMKQYSCVGKYIEKPLSVNKIKETMKDVT